MKNLFLLLLIVFGGNGCVKVTAQDLTGVWLAKVPTVIGPIPFELKIEKNGDLLKVFAINAAESLEFDTPVIKGDSIIISMGIFDAEIRAKIVGDQMHGIYAKKMADLSTRSGEFTAIKNGGDRFGIGVGQPKHQISGKYRTIFTDDEGISYEAVGLFAQNGHKVSGTFMTTTGDYRFLAGNIVDDSLMLSCFDGTHIFLFKALIKHDSLVGGRFCSSLRYTETWQAVKDEKAELPDAETLTYLKEGYEGINFKFVNTQGDSISLDDPRYKNKVIILQIMGSWCPNCMDESRFLAPWYEQNKNRGVEIIGLAFERNGDTAFAFPKIEKMKERFGIGYEVLLAGVPADADKVLVMLNHVMSFPTTIFIDKRGKIRKIHTGFSGPSTGNYYHRYVANFGQFLEELMTEK